VLPNLGRAQQKGLLALGALVLSYAFISHWVNLPQTSPVTPAVITARQEVHIELIGAVQRPGLFTYRQPPTVFRVIEDGGGLTGRSKIPAQRGQEVLTKDTRMAVSAVISGTT